MGGGARYQPENQLNFRAAWRKDCLLLAEPQKPH